MPADRSGAARTVDLRPLEAPPFDAVVAALGELSPDETVEFVVGFAPVPLYDVLEARGWRYEADRAGPDEWRVRVESAGADEPAGADHTTGYARRRSGERLRRPRTDRLPEPTHP